MHFHTGNRAGRVVGAVQGDSTRCSVRLPAYRGDSAAFAAADFAQHAPRTGSSVDGSGRLEEGHACPDCC